MTDDEVCLCAGYNNLTKYTALSTLRVLSISAVRSTVHEYLSKSKSFGHLFYLSKSKK